MSKYNLTDLITESKMNLSEGTRAMVAYLDGNKLTTTYNHYDGYPENLGKGLMRHYDDDAKAKEIANKGYITYLDPASGEIEQTHKDEAGSLMLSDDAEERAREIAEKIDSMWGNYGYIWDSNKNEWITIKNNGIRSMVDQIMDELGNNTMEENMEENIEEATMANVNVDEIKFHLDAYEAGTIDGDDLHQAISEIFFGKVEAPGMFIDDEEWEREMGRGVKEDEVEEVEEVTEEKEEVDEAMMPRPSLFKGTETEIKSYLDSLKREYDRDKEKFKKDYLDFSDDDWKEDFGNYAADKALQEHFGRFLKDYQ